ncbi:DNA topoisomerase I [Rhodospirillum rubrum]|uniref:type I DNA topoisomerase n=1 Tax=Rhodospirillum rubrum TaxID=1085 RepID=UPI0019059391|nr:type I DNA topoisomerase [Rhodospirillum rubrum]MBK1663424.1 DNA topoisomerase I [Rhodospirillum rubrum]MBK1675393.1 DNA topoisomerase I [Rhodospirillum rubrum]
MHVVVVESPAKAKTINKYLGKDYVVLASYGHIRDLPPKDGSVRPDEGFAMDWEIDAKAEKHVKDITQALKSADGLLLATDPDREGEAISWHVRDVLEKRKALVGKQVQRITFNAITRSAVEEALRNPRDLDTPLVEAYLARRALDYLVGFTLSPVLWRKLPGSRSAGRVQSVALRLICEREQEVERFVSREYWTVDAILASPQGQIFRARLSQLDGQKLDKFGLPDETTALAALERIKAATLRVSSVERKQARRNPAAPFTTSTIQQEASRKLYFSARQTMQVAQKLYEGVDLGGETVGLITYMRTDGVSIAPEAVFATRDLIGAEFGAAYLPEQPRVYKTKAKNAQEAHEAIRPTDVARTPQSVAPYLTAEQRKLYELVWKRTVASQMASAILDQVAVDIADPEAKVVLHATGSVIQFDGFLKVYREDFDDRPENSPDGAGEDENRLLPPLREGDGIKREDVKADQHFTQPPPRYTEASLVKRMEELGIGRPSTYASILSVLQDREYVRLDARRFIPEDRGRLVTAFLENFFSRYVQYSFTADLENQLDEISDGKLGWKTVLERFWMDFKAAIEGTATLRVSEVLDALDKELGPHLFPQADEGHDPRVCPVCSAGRLGLRIGKFGAFVGCSNYPDCKFTRPLVTKEGEGGDGAALAEDGTKPLGKDPVSGEDVTLRKGPYGLYVQKGEAAPVEKGKKAVKPPRVSIPKDMDVASVDLDIALKLLSLPRPVGDHPETGTMISAGIGRFGPYIKHGDIYKSLPKDDDVLTIGLNRAVSLLAEAGKGGRARQPARSLGDHPADTKPVTIHDGRFGPYVQHGGVRATIPRTADPATYTLAEAVELIAAKAAKDGEGKKAPAKKAATKAPVKKAAAEKKAPAKTATKKAAPKKAADSAEEAPAKAPRKTKAKPASADPD